MPILAGYYWGMRYIIKILFILSTSIMLTAHAQTESFKVVPLGVKGGIDEGNLSAYMVAVPGNNQYICLDAGTLHAGIEKAIQHKTFNVGADEVLKNYIKAYFISHSHLDHLSGLIINSPDDVTKPIYANKACIEVFKNNYFTWKSWANFANEGEKPQVGKYTYQAMQPNIEYDVAHTGFKVQAFPLSHANLESTAFLVNHNGDYLLYLGDTGADEIEKSHNLQNLWQAVAPLIKKHRLKAIMIEVSFPNEQPDKNLFGHLTPKWLMQEMRSLSSYSGPLKGLNVIITHVKPPKQNINLLKHQLHNYNPFGLNLIFPEQGKALAF